MSQVRKIKKEGYKYNKETSKFNSNYYLAAKILVSTNETTAPFNGRKSRQKFG